MTTRRLISRNMKNMGTPNWQKPIKIGEFVHRHFGNAHKFKADRRWCCAKLKVTTLLTRSNNWISVGFLYALFDTSNVSKDRHFQKLPNYIIVTFSFLFRDSCCTAKNCCRLSREPSKMGCLSLDLRGYLCENLKMDAIYCRDILLLWESLPARRTVYSIRFNRMKSIIKMPLPWWRHSGNISFTLVRLTSNK